MDILTSFEPETLARHVLSVSEGGAIIYDASEADTPLHRIPFLDERTRQDLSCYLEARGLPCSTAGLLTAARLREIRTYAVPFDEITHALARKLQVAQAVVGRTLNTAAVAVSCAVLGYDPEYLRRGLKKVFAGRARVLEMNEQVVALTYDLVHETWPVQDFPYRLIPQESHQQRLLVNGNQAVALGKLAAGMSFQTYYPISPATDESVYLEAHESFRTIDGEEASVLVVQTEDELAAVTMASGATLTGAQSATATSGPGFSLMAEGLGWAGINEVPLVVTLYQRGGPSTGMPTRSEQGDLQCAIHAGHGEFPRLVLASGDIQEAFYDAAQAFNYAERYQTLVIHLLDKALASTTQTLPPFDVSSIRIERGAVYTPPAAESDNGSYTRFSPTLSGISPRALLGQPDGTHWLTGGEHTVYGRVTEDPVVREQMMEKRARKMALAAHEIPLDEKLKVYGAPYATFTVVSWGSNQGAIREALQLLEADGIYARLVQIRLLWPFPADELLPLLERASPLVVVELNYSGQLAHLLREQTGRQSDNLVVKYNGRPMSGHELYHTFNNIHAGRAEPRIVLRNPYE